MTSFKLTICDVKSTMASSTEFRKRLLEKLPDIKIHEISYDETLDNSVYIYYELEEDVIQVVGSSNRHSQGPGIISYANTIDKSHLYSYSYVIQWIEHIRSNHKKTESYNVF